jgi:4-hydroxybenzoate polyprenyltransferase
MGTSSTARLCAWLDLIRVFNIPIPLAGMLVGASAATSSFPRIWPVLAIAATLGCAAIQCFNDHEDRAVDVQNAAFRPIPSGRLGASEVLVAGQLLILVWALISLYFSAAAAGIVVIICLLTRWYSRVKKVSLGHHLLLPAALGLTPAYGSVMVSGEVHVLAYFAGLSIFLIDVNMNIVGAFKDIWDASARERVLPVVWGPRPAIMVALVVGLGGILVQVIPISRGLCGLAPLVPLSLGAALTLRSRLRLFRSPCAARGYAALKSGRLTECLTFPALIAGLLPLRDALLTIGALTCFALFTQTVIHEARLPHHADASRS